MPRRKIKESVLDLRRRTVNFRRPERARNEGTTGRKRVDDTPRKTFKAHCFSGLICKTVVSIFLNGWRFLGFTPGQIIKWPIRIQKPVSIIMSPCNSKSFAYTKNFFFCNGAPLLAPQLSPTPFPTAWSLKKIRLGMTLFNRPFGSGRSKKRL